MNRVPRTFNRLVPSAGIRRLTISYLMPTMKVELLKKFHPRNVPDLLVMYLLFLTCILVILPLRHSNPFVILSEAKNLPFQNEDDARRDSTFRIRRKRFYLENFQRATRFCETYTGYEPTVFMA